MSKRTESTRAIIGMAIVVALALGLLLWSVNAMAAPIVRQYFTNKVDVIVAWDYDNATNPDVTGFKLYTMPVGTTTPTVTNIPGKGTRQFTWANFPAGQFIAYLTAIDRYGNESDQSEWIQINKSITKPSKPINDRIQDSFVVINMP